jgi:nitrilase
MEAVRFAAIQMSSGDNVAHNCAVASELLQRAADDRARLAVLPENFALMGADPASRVQIAEAPGDGPLHEFLRDSARRIGMWVVGGTIPVNSDEPERPYASCYVFDDHGNRVGRYDKIHLFDVALPGSDESYCESASTKPGEMPLVVATPWGRLAVAVCYDLRFPELFRYLCNDGMDFLALPAAFTHPTGAAHWESLLRARAIENLCYVVASAQVGMHPGGRRTYGHSMIVDPWGGHSFSAAAECDVVSAVVAPERLQVLRDSFPALSHRRLSVARPEQSARRSQN